jgi:hypothetical protein
VTDRFILYDLFSLPNKTRMIKLRRMRWVGPAALIGNRRGPYRVLLGGPVALIRNRRGAYRVLLGRPEGKAPLERCKLR